MHARTHTHTRLTALFPGLPGWAGTRKVKPIWVSLKQETVSGSGISWAICKSEPRSRQITTPATHHSVFIDQMPCLQHQSTEGHINHMHGMQRCNAMLPMLHGLCVSVYPWAVLKLMNRLICRMWSGLYTLRVGPSNNVIGRSLDRPRKKNKLCGWCESPLLRCSLLSKFFDHLQHYPQCAVSADSQLAYWTLA